MEKPASSPAREEKDWSWVYTVALILTAIVFTVMFLLYPHLNDDVWYREEWAGFLRSHSLTDFFRGWYDTVSVHYKTDNIRLSNILGAVAVIMPKWFIAPVLGACVSLGICYTAKLTGVWKRSLSLTILIIFFWVFALPWNDFMFSVIYAMNYVVPTAFLFVVMYLYQKGMFRGLFSAFLCGFLLGWWHELFGAVLLAYVGVLYISSARYHGKNAITMAVGAFLAILFLTLAPGTSARADDMSFLWGFTSMLNVQYAHLFILAVLLVALVWSVKRWRPALKSPVALALLGALMASFVVWRLSEARVHVAWVMHVVSIAIIVLLLNRCPVRVPGWMTTGLAWLMTVAVTVHLCLCLPWFARMNQEVTYARAMQLQNPGQTVFAPQTMAGDVPDYLLGKPNFDAYKIWKTGLDNVVPEDLKDFRAESDRAVMMADSLLLYDGKFLVSLRDEHTEFQKLAVTIAGSRLEDFTFCIPFRGADGGRYTYLRMFRVTKRLSHHPIEKVEIL